MKFSRCKCGKAVMWGDGTSPPDCHGCEECGTTYAQHPDEHRPLIPHDWAPRYSSTTGEQVGRRCKRCHSRAEHVGAS